MHKEKGHCEWESAEMRENKERQKLILDVGNMHKMFKKKKD